MSSIYGKNIKVSVFGQSHSDAIGVVVDGLPAGFRIDTERLERFCARRAPGQNAMSTARREADAPRFVSGLADGVTCGAPLCAVISNTDTRSGDYKSICDIPRPGHADYTAHVKYGGANDVSGGGHFSGRLTAPLCIAGGIALQLLNYRGIDIGAHVLSIADVRDKAYCPVSVSERELHAQGFPPVLDPEAGKKMEEAIMQAKRSGDSVGGIIECAVTGLPVGLGDPMFDGMENRISSAVFAVPAVKGIEFGAGFACAGMRGSENNDAFYMAQDGSVRTKTNNHGGILGGITSGMPLVFRAAVKPTPSIAAMQESVSLSKGENASLQIHGRHDPCIVPRAVPAIEAAAALAILDAYLEGQSKWN